jgi:DNA-binding SARP family transcriptional activator/tetratricopeptide (TPR) repeat protein
VVPNVESGVGKRVESDGLPRSAEACRLRIRILGPLEIRREGAVLPLPASRKVRALLAYLALAPREASRGQLCELLWDVPTDPRGELRWCLSKIRRLVDDADHQRILAREDAIRLDLADCFVDALEVQRAMKEGAGPLGTGAADALATLFGGDLLEGLEMDRSPAFAGWLAAQRRRFRSAHVALLERLATQGSDEESLGHLEKWLELAPFDRRAHELLLGALARCGRLREGEEHLRAATRRFEEEGLDVTAVHRAWHAARKQERGRPPTSTACAAPEVAVPGGGPGHATAAARRASVAVMPFQDGAGAADRRGWSDALAHDVITRLAKLRSLFVIAEGTVFALKERQLPPEAAGRTLNVDYVVAGALRVTGDRLSVEVQLDETRTARVVWSERFDQPLDDAFEVIDEIGNRIVASIAGEIEANERNRAILKPPSSLDAWEAHHRGLWHMYRFTRADNAAAGGFFERAVALDPTFSRAHAGLSFTHWQNAFQGWADREPETARALEAARRGMLVDDRDPAVHWAQGRALWLRGLHDPSVLELEQAVDLSPNFAQGHYSLAFVQAQAGDPLAAIAAADRSRDLSPFDPLLFGMLGARAIALVRLGRFPEAAEAAVKAAARPNAHAHIFAIAAFSLALHDALDEGRAYAAATRRILPGYTLAHFRKAFRLDRDGEGRFAEGARRIGMA